MLAKSSTDSKFEGLPSHFLCPQDFPVFLPPTFSPIFLLIAMVPTEEEARALPADQKPPVMHLVAKCQCPLAHDHALFLIGYILASAELIACTWLINKELYSTGPLQLFFCSKMWLADTDTSEAHWPSWKGKKKNRAENTQYKMPQTPSDLQGGKPDLILMTKIA